MSPLGNEPAFVTTLRRYIQAMGVRPRRTVGITAKQLEVLEKENLLDAPMEEGAPPTLWGQPLAVVIHDIDRDPV